MPYKTGTMGSYLAHEPVITLPNGLFEMTRGKFECDVVGCRHCGAIIKILLSGVNASPETKYTCMKCNGPICKYCAENLKGASGNCFPILAQAEFKMKYGCYPHEMGILDFREASSL